MIKRILAVIISFLLYPGMGAQPAAFAAKSPEKLRCSAVIISDTHMETNNPARFIRMGSTLRGVAAAEQTPDTVCFTGDCTMNGQELEWFDFYGFTSRYLRDSRVIVSYGNHDFGNTDNHETYEKLRKTCIDNYNYFCGDNTEGVYHSHIINGYRFIALGSEDNAPDTVEVITDSQIEWLKGELKKSSDDGLPAIVLNHNLIYGRNGDRSTFSFNQTNNNDALDDALQSCGTKVIYFCGHSHFGVNDGSVSTDGNVTYVNLPSAGNTGNYRAQGEYADSGIGVYLEIYEDSMLLRFRNFAKGRFLDGFDNIVIDL